MTKPLPETIKELRRNVLAGSRVTCHRLDGTKTIDIRVNDKTISHLLDALEEAIEICKVYSEIFDTHLKQEIDFGTHKEEAPNVFREFLTKHRIGGSDDT